MTILPQFAMLTGCGATKSFTSAGNDADERLFRNALPNAVQTLDEKMPAAVMLIAASPNSSPARVPPATASVMVPELTWPSAKPAALRLTRLPQHGTAFAEKHWLLAPVVTQRSRPSTGLPPPLVKSKVIRMSPALRF